MDSSMAGTGRAGYDSQNKTISFVTDSEINTQTLKEELFHAVQDASYPGGIYQYGTCVRSNIEFEAKLYTDVSKLGCCSMFPNQDLIPENIRYDYVVMVNKIRSEGNSGFTSESYNYWVNLFRQYSNISQYKGLTSNSFSNTNVLNSALVNCK